MENGCESLSNSQHGPRIQLSDNPESIHSTRFHLVRIFSEKYKKEHVEAMEKTLAKIITSNVG